MSAGLALAVSGCLGGDDTAAPPAAVGAFDSGIHFPVLDASLPDSAAPATDAGGDAASDASTPIVDASTDAAKGGSASTAGLVSGGTVSRSPNYTLIGGTTPATAPVLQSPKYQLSGGVTATK
jgi:hypothetical protein